MLPIYVTSSDGTYDWWNVSIIENSTNQYKLTVQNEIDGLIGHQTSSILTTVSPLDSKNHYLGIGNVNTSGGITIPSQFSSGVCYSQIQELRGWSEILTTSSLNTHTLNPESYVGNFESSSYDALLWRFPLGNDLNIYNHSIITSLTGSQPKISNVYLKFSGSWNVNNYNSFVETYYSIPAVGGYSTPVTDKIRIVTQNTSSNILHPQKSIIYSELDNTRTTDIHLTQTGLSPQDQINNDIIAQLGDSYNLDNIIGNPLSAGLYSYTELEQLRNQYFKKYKNKYNYKDFVQLIETFHKSLFRYITESIPGRSEESTGIVIKPHILERSKVKRYEPTIDTSSYDALITIGEITGSNAGNYCCSRNSPFNEAFINGNFSGSEMNLQEYYSQNNPFIKYPVTVNTKLFNEQYGGWDALNNNVSSSIISKYKKIEIKQSSYLENYDWDDSLLTNTSYLESRELGVKTISNDFNLPILTGSIPYAGAISNAEKTITYMAFSDWAGNSLAEKYGTSNFHIKWLIDEDGNVYKPQISSSYYWNTDQTFGAGTPVNIAVYSGDGNILQDYDTITHMPLKNYDVILYTETGSLGTDYLQSGSYTDINFEINPTLIAPSLDLDTGLNSSTSISPIVFDVITTDEANSYNSANGIYTAAYTTEQPVRIESRLRVDNTSGGTINYTARLMKNGVAISTTSFSLSTGNTTLLTVSKIETLIFGDEYYVEVDGLSGLSSRVVSAQTYFRVTAITNSAAIPTNTIFPAILNTKTLIMSNSLYPYYGAFTQTPKTDSGFSDPILFEIKKYDQIRFENSENFIYTIMDVSFDNSFNPPRILLTLDREIPVYYLLGIPIPNINLNNFTIRRLVDNVGFIIVNNNPQYQTGTTPSFIIPKYASKKLRDNLDNIIQNLYQKNLL